MTFILFNCEDVQKLYQNCAKRVEIWVKFKKNWVNVFEKYLLTLYIYDENSSYESRCQFRPTSVVAIVIISSLLA